MKRCTFFCMCGHEYRNGVIIEYRNRGYNCSKTGFMIYKVINYELVKYETWALLLLESDSQPSPSLFPWLLKQIHCCSAGGWLPLALKGSPQWVIVLSTLSLGYIGFRCWHLSCLSPCPAKLDVQWPMIIRILITGWVDYDYSYFLGLEKSSEFNK